MRSCQTSMDPEREEKLPPPRPSHHLHAPAGIGALTSAEARLIYRPLPHYAGDLGHDGGGTRPNCPEYPTTHVDGHRSFTR
jgi:hypothetical protein